MDITTEQAFVYLRACRAAASMAEEYRNEKSFNYWMQQVRKLEIMLRIPLNERCWYTYYP